MNKFCAFCNNKVLKEAKCCKYCIRSVIIEGDNNLLCSKLGHSVVGCDLCPYFISRYERSNYLDAETGKLFATN